MYAYLEVMSINIHIMNLIYALINATKRSIYSIETHNVYVTIDIYTEKLFRTYDLHLIEINKA